MTDLRYTVFTAIGDIVEESDTRTLLVSTAVCMALGLALAWTGGVDDASAQEPTPTPNLSFQGNATPMPGTYIVTPAPVSYSLTVSNVGQTEADSVVLRVDTVDINPDLFQSTHGTCTWAPGPDYYHGHGSGQCDLGALAPAGGPEPSSAVITLSGDVFWNFYSNKGPWIWFTGWPSGQVVGGASWPFGTPTPTATLASSDPVGGIAELPDAAESARVTTESSRGSAMPYAAIAGAGAASVLLLPVGVWYARKRWSTSE